LGVGVKRGQHGKGSKLLNDKGRKVEGNPCESREHEKEENLSCPRECPGRLAGPVGGGGGGGVLDRSSLTRGASRKKGTGNQIGN